jgi:L-threonylcarbamoyladenylate synthase
VSIAAEAAAILRAGGLVALPTETVYGLAADATQGKAVARIFEAKGRPAFNPLISHVGGRDWVADLAETDWRFETLAAAFWPGPLTFVLRRAKGCPISQLATAGLATLALRMPAHPMALEILKAAQRPLAAPSANISGTVSPTQAAHVAAALGGKVDLIVDGGPCAVGIESTVIDLSGVGAAAAILRPGRITAEEIAALIGPVSAQATDEAAPRSPGQTAAHYAPSIPLRINAAAARTGEALLGFGPAPGAALNLSPGGDLKEAAANLFGMIRKLDDPVRYTSIAVSPVPAVGIGIAINDRLERAARGR